MIYPIVEEIKKVNGKVQQIVISASKAQDAEYVKRVCKRFKPCKKVLIKFTEQADPKQNCLFNEEETARLIESKQIFEKNGIQPFLFSDRYRKAYDLNEVIIANQKLDSWAKKINTATTIDDNGQTRPLSPLEKFLYAYLLVANVSPYKSENENEPYITSRGAIDVLNGTKIVCVGYANLLCALCEKIGIPCQYQLYILSGQKSDTGHAACNVYIKDEIYGIEDIYSSDPTWDNSNGSILFSLIPHKYFNSLFRISRTMMETDWDYQEGINGKDEFIKAVKSQTHKFDEVLDEFAKGTIGEIQFRFKKAEKDEREKGERATKKYIKQILFPPKTKNKNSSYFKSLNENFVSATHKLWFADESELRRIIIETANKILRENKHLSQQEIVDKTYYAIVHKLVDAKDTYNKALTKIDAKEIELCIFETAISHLPQLESEIGFKSEDIIKRTEEYALDQLDAGIKDIFATKNAFFNNAAGVYLNTDKPRYIVIERDKRSLEILKKNLKDYSKKAKIINAEIKTCKQELSKGKMFRVTLFPLLYTYLTTEEFNGLYKKGKLDPHQVYENINDVLKSLLEERKEIAFNARKARRRIKEIEQAIAQYEQTCKELDE